MIIPIGEVLKTPAPEQVMAGCRTSPVHIAVNVSTGSQSVDFRKR